ncbi:hypothetical protein CDAR_596371 [Caerostris darwini]|uniref:Uncharacterized protein n=1 Tax=Caerostris darwini TaxID=1538125 RepID=A0AAV4UXQ3_9ARAC|nr:hypothetical protein CDAR_596371 [Caerostris darwini]
MRMFAKFYSQDKHPFRNFDRPRRFRYMLGQFILGIGKIIRRTENDLEGLLKAGRYFSSFKIGCFHTIEIRFYSRH